MCNTVSAISCTLPWLFGFCASSPAYCGYMPRLFSCPRDVRDRVAAWARAIAESGTPTGAVCHQGIIRAALSLATGWSMVGKPPEKMDWESVHIFHAHADGRFEIAELNVSLLQAPE